MQSCEVAGFSKSRRGLGGPGREKPGGGWGVGSTEGTALFDLGLPCGVVMSPKEDIPGLREIGSTRAETLPRRNRGHTL